MFVEINYGQKSVLSFLHSFVLSFIQLFVKLCLWSSIRFIALHTRKQNCLLVFYSSSRSVSLLPLTLQLPQQGIVCAISFAFSYLECLPLSSASLPFTPPHNIFYLILFFLSGPLCWIFSRVHTTLHVAHFGR